MHLCQIGVSSLLCFSFMLAGCSSSKQPARDIVTTSEQPAVKRIASADVVKAVPQPVEITAGSSAEATVRLKVDDGYHVNANPPTYSYLKATELEIASGQGLSASSVTYPPPLNRKFPFAEKALAVYEGETVIKTTLAADKSASKGERSISAILRIQACDDQVCYPPGTIDLQIPVTIK